jgi:hypothetical protein
MRSVVLVAVLLTLACPFQTGFTSGEVDYSAEAKVTIPPKSYSADELTTKEHVPWWEKIWIVKKGEGVVGVRSFPNVGR